jgi:hypothetical protein
MNRIHVAVLAGLLGASAAQGVVVTAGESGSGWLAFMNVYETPANGGGFVFASGWGMADLNTSFNDAADTMTFSPNTIGDPNPFWYTPAGGPGSTGNKVMEANAYYEVNASYAGQAVTFQGTILSNTLTSAHEGTIFVKDFAPDYSSFVAATMPMTPGAFSLTLNTINDPARHVQWGFQVKGVCVWVTDVAPFGNVVISTAIPQPASLAVLGLSGLVATRRRRN